MVDTLKSLDTVTGAENGAEMTIINIQTGTPMQGKDGEARIKLRGFDAETYRADLDREIARINEQKRKSASTPADNRKAEIEVLARNTLGWSNLMETQDKELEYSQANARMLYTNFPWLREQVQAFVEDRRNFLPEL